MSDDTKVPLPDLENVSDVQMVADAGPLAPTDPDSVNRGAADLEDRKSTRLNSSH